MSQADFGKTIGITGQSVSAIEKGGGIKMETLLKIKELHKCDLMSEDANLELKSETSYTEKMMIIFQEKEKQYLDIISRLTIELGKPLGNPNAIVAILKKIRLQSGLHQFSIME